MENFASSLRACCLAVGAICASGFAQEPITVKTLQPSRATLQLSTKQPATVHPFQEADLAARVSGYVKSVGVDIGDAVAEGDILAEIDAPEMKIQAERKEAEIQLLSSKKDQLDASVKASEALVRAEKLEFERVQKLVKTGAVTGRIHDESQSRMESAEADLAVAQAEVKGALASIEVAKKELEELQTMMGYATLRAPFAGVVTKRDLDPGDLVKVADSSATAGPLFQVAMVDTVRVRVAVPEVDAVYINPKDPAEFTCRALRGTVFKGEVARSSRSIDTRSGSMQVEIDLENPDGRLIPGMFGEATIALESRENVLTLPAGAVRFNATGDAAEVYVVENGKIKVTPVKTGIDDGVQIEITEGLNGNEQVVAGGLGRLADGTAVTVLAAEESE